MPSPARQSTAPGKPQTLFAAALAAFGLCFALGLPLNNLYDIWATRDLELHGRPATARIGTASDCPTKAGPATCHLVSYEVEGKAYSARNARQDLALGQARAIFYAPVAPAYFRFADLPRSSHWDDELGGRMLTSLALGAIFALGAGLILKDALRSLLSG